MQVSNTLNNNDENDTSTVSSPSNKGYFSSSREDTGLIQQEENSVSESKLTIKQPKVKKENEGG